MKLIRHMLLWHNKRRHLVISHSHTQYSGGINSVENHLMMTRRHVIQDSYLVLDIHQRNTVAPEKKAKRTSCALTSPLFLDSLE